MSQEIIDKLSQKDMVAIETLVSNFMNCDWDKQSEEDKAKLAQVYRTTTISPDHKQYRDKVIEFALKIEKHPYQCQTMFRMNCLKLEAEYRLIN